MTSLVLVRALGAQAVSSYSREAAVPMVSRPRGGHDGIELDATVADAH